MDAATRRKIAYTRANRIGPGICWTGNSGVAQCPHRSAWGLASNCGHCSVVAWRLSFAGGSVLSRNSKLSLNPFVCAGWEMLAASFCDLVLATSLRQWGHAVWNRDGISAIAFLVLFGSLVGFSSYTWLLQNVPVSKVATYAYINPVVAVLLGAFLLGERMHRNEWVGMLIILPAVVLVTSSKLQPDSEIAEIESMATEVET
ncbi:MAG: EamA family transporter [Acidobacteriaceae bacterium]